MALQVRANKIVSLRKVLAQIQSIEGKQERGIGFKNELDLLGREMKVVKNKKLGQLDGGNK